MAAKKASKKFIVGWSDCGDLSQLEVNDCDTFSTILAAQKYIDESIASGDYNADITYFVLGIVARGKCTGVKWE